VNKFFLVILGTTLLFYSSCKKEEEIVPVEETIVEISPWFEVYLSYIPGFYTGSLSYKLNSKSDQLYSIPEYKIEVIISNDGGFEFAFDPIIALDSTYHIDNIQFEFGPSPISSFPSSEIILKPNQKYIKGEYPYQHYFLVAWPDKIVLRFSIVALDDEAIAELNLNPAIKTL